MHSSLRRIRDGQVFHVVVSISYGAPLLSRRFLTLVGKLSLNSYRAQLPRVFKLAFVFDWA